MSTVIKTESILEQLFLIFNTVIEYVPVLFIVGLIVVLPLVILPSEVVQLYEKLEPVDELFPNKSIEGELQVISVSIPALAVGGIVSIPTITVSVALHPLFRAVTSKI